MTIAFVFYHWSDSRDFPTLLSMLPSIGAIAVALPVVVLGTVNGRRLCKQAVYNTQSFTYAYVPELTRLLQVLRTFAMLSYT